MVGEGEVKEDFLVFDLGIYVIVIGRGYIKGC